MPDLMTLTCPTCGGKLQITDKISTFACGHCGNEHIVHREGGMIYLAPLAQDVRHIRTGVDKTAAELAIARLAKEISQLEQEYGAAEQFPPQDAPQPPNEHARRPKPDAFMAAAVFAAIVLGSLLINGFSSVKDGNLSLPILPVLERVND